MRVKTIEESNFFSLFTVLFYDIPVDCLSLISLIRPMYCRTSDINLTACEYSTASFIVLLARTANSGLVV